MNHRTFPFAFFASLVVSACSGAPETTGGGLDSHASLGSSDDDDGAAGDDDTTGTPTRAQGSRARGTTGSAGNGDTTAATGSTGSGTSTSGGTGGGGDTGSGGAGSGGDIGSGAGVGGGGEISGGTSTGSGGPAIVVSQKAAMPPIGLGRPAQANYAQSPALDAIDTDYGTAWRTNHVPTSADPSWIAIDLSDVPVVQRTTVYSLWFNENGYNYDTSDGDSYTLPGDFEIQANAAAGGGQAPLGGWVTLTSTTGNVLSSGANLLNLSGYQWVRFHCTASAANAAPQNEDLSLQWNLYDAHNGNDGWKFGGDSITAGSMGHEPSNDSFDQLIQKKVANVPAFEMAGHGGWSTGTMLGAIDAFLANFPGAYFGLALGTNDAPGNDPAAYHASMKLLIDKVIAAGKTPVVPMIPYTGDPSHAQIPAYNAEIVKLYAEYGAELVHGPDLYSVLYAGRATMFDSDTDLHPNAAGNTAIRAAWATAMVTAVYQ